MIFKDGFGKIKFLNLAFGVSTDVAKPMERTKLVMKYHLTR